MHKISNTNLIASAILVFALGGFTGIILTNDSKMKLEVAMIEEMERFIDDMKWDLQEGIVDTNYAEYYISWFSSLKDQLEYKPEEERYYYE